ncbi:MAG: hypothetical protein ACLVEL_04040 [Ruthenibacterium sp.]
MVQCKKRHGFHHAVFHFFALAKQRQPAAVPWRVKRLSLSVSSEARDGIQYQKMQHAAGRILFTGGGASDAGDRVFSAF